MSGIELTTPPHKVKMRGYPLHIPYSISGDEVVCTHTKKERTPFEYTQVRVIQSLVKLGCSVDLKPGSVGPEL